MTALTSLAPSILLSIYDHAMQSYPEECCGLVYGQHVRRCINIQTSLHHQDATRYPRDGRSGYTLSFADQVFLNNHLSGEKAVSVVYHSHPDVGAYFSQEDHNRAVYEGRPIYSADYLVVDIRRGTVACSKLFRFHDGRYQLIEVFPGREALDQHRSESSN